MLKLDGGNLYVQDIECDASLYLQSDDSCTNLVTLTQFEQKPNDEKVGKVQLPVGQEGLPSVDILLSKTAFVMTRRQSYVKSPLSLSISNTGRIFHYNFIIKQCHRIQQS